MVANKVQYHLLPLFSSDQKYLIIDDTYDTGYTYKIISELLSTIDSEYDFMFLLDRYGIKDSSYKNKMFVEEYINHEKWIVFPWEKLIK